MCGIGIFMGFQNAIIHRRLEIDMTYCAHCSPGSSLTYTSLGIAESSSTLTPESVMAAKVRQNPQVIKSDRTLYATDVKKQFPSPLKT